MSGRVIQLGGGVLTKHQLAQHLGRSERWIELRVRDGMPSLDPTMRYPHRRFRLHEVEAWLSEGQRRTPSTAARLSMLEAEVATLRRIVSNLDRSAS